MKVKVVVLLLLGLSLSTPALSEALTDAKKAAIRE